MRLRPEVEDAVGRHLLDAAYWYPTWLNKIASAVYNAGCNWTLSSMGRYSYAFAALSPKVNPEQNLKLFESLLTYGPRFVGHTKLSVASAVRCLETGYPPKGRKTGPFGEALAGAHDAVAVDRHVLTAFGLPEKVCTSAFMDVVGSVRHEANRRGVPPRTMQAAIWLAVKDLKAAV